MFFLFVFMCWLSRFVLIVIVYTDKTTFFRLMVLVYTNKILLNISFLSSHIIGYCSWMQSFCVPTTYIKDLFNFLSMMIGLMQALGFHEIRILFLFERGFFLLGGGVTFFGQGRFHDVCWAEIH